MRGFITPKVCRVLQGTDEFNHTFGGPAFHIGAIPKGTDGPLHLLYNLNLNDPKLGMKLKTTDWLPLYHPLAYDGASLKYRVISPKKIEIVHFDRTEHQLGWQYPMCSRNKEGEWIKHGPDYPEYFPRTPILLQPATYEERRALTYTSVYYDIAGPEDRADRDLLRGKFRHARMGGFFETHYLHRSEAAICGSADCKGVIEQFAIIFNEPAPGSYLWQPLDSNGKPLDSAGGADVEVIFSMCSECELIYTFNFCT